MKSKSKNQTVMKNSPSTPCSPVQNLPTHFAPVCSFHCSPRRRPIRAGGRKLTFARLRRECLSESDSQPSTINHQPAKRLLAIPFLALCVTGCTILSYQSPTGEHFTRSSLGSKTSIAHLTFEANTNGVRKLQLKGYDTRFGPILGHRHRCRRQSRHQRRQTLISISVNYR
jgi:hypothetical protein